MQVSSNWNTRVCIYHTIRFNRGLISFQDPTNYMYALLTNTRRLSTHSHKHDLANVEERKDRTLSKIRDGRKRVQSEIADFRDKLELAKDTIAR